MTKTEWIVGLAFVGVLATLPFIAHLARRDTARLCAFDGARIEPLYAVRITDGAGAEHEFCCVRCARQWLERDSRSPRRILVTDETTGAEIDAASAIFVRSFVVTQRSTGNRIHAFGT